MEMLELNLSLQDWSAIARIQRLLLDYENTGIAAIHTDLTALRLMLHTALTSPHPAVYLAAKKLSDNFTTEQQALLGSLHTNPRPNQHGLALADSGRNKSPDPTHW